MKALRNRHTLFVALVLFVFTIMLATGAVLGTVLIGLVRLDIVPWRELPRFPLVIWSMLLMSIVIGTALAALLGSKPLRPIRALIAATQEIANGNFSVRVNLRGPYELTSLAASFNRMAQELGNTETLRRDFINNFSHEFRTPIVSIRGFAKLLKKETLSREERDEYIDIIITESERLADLSSSVLALSKLEHQEIISERTTYQLDEQIRRSILLLEPQWSKKGLDLQVELDPLQLTANEELLQQVWLNLVDNAIKFTPPGGSIQVSLESADSHAKVLISDTGIGMDECTKQHLFDRFYQGDKSHSVPGNGLGLALVKRIIELSGGVIRVESELGRGATFTVELPLQT